MFWSDVINRGKIEENVEIPLTFLESKKNKYTLTEDEIIICKFGIVI